LVRSQRLRGSSKTDLAKKSVRAKPSLVLYVIVPVAPENRSNENSFRAQRLDETPQYIRRAAFPFDGYTRIETDKVLAVANISPGNEIMQLR
jgi:hypothetical protein